MKKEIIDSLTGIRGIAAIYVVIYHLFHNSYNINFINNGYLSVDLFFILSGFIITHAHRNDFINTTNIRNYMKFILSRIIRIWPAYVCWVFFNVGLLLFKGQQPQLSTFISNILMIQNLGLSPSIIGTGWSLSVEFFAYFFFPFMCILAMKKEKIHSVVLLCISILLISAISIVKVRLIAGSQIKFSGPLDIMSFDGAGALIRGLCEFCMGIVSYRIYLTIKENTSKNLTTWTYVACIIIFTCLSLKGMDVLFSICIFLLLPLLAIGKNPITAFLSSQTSIFLGKISFSLYLCHIPLVYAINSRVENLTRHFISNPILSSLFSGLISIAACIIVAWVSYEVCEKRLRLKINKLMVRSQSKATF
ncbi:TPA: acyltransferase [Klebsiella pneumoniae]|nr:acyltransferase [Klebsiella pneumoniae]